MARTRAPSAASAAMRLDRGRDRALGRARRADAEQRVDDEIGCDRRRSPRRRRTRGCRRRRRGRGRAPAPRRRGSAAAAPTRSTVVGLPQPQRRVAASMPSPPLLPGPAKTTMRRACGARASARRATASPARAMSVKGGNAASASPSIAARRGDAEQRDPADRAVDALDVAHRAQSLDAEAVDLDRRLAADDRVGDEARRAHGERPAAAAVADVEPDALGAARPEHRRPVGQHRPRAFPALRRAAPRHAGEPVVEHHVERRLGALVLALGVAADLGAAGDADALAEAADRDLVALVHQRRARLEVEVLRRRGAAAPSPSSRARRCSGRCTPSGFSSGRESTAAQTTIGVEARLGGLAGLRLRRRPLARRRASAAPRRARRAAPAGRASRGSLPARICSTWALKRKTRAGALGLLAQQVGELATVADLVVLRIDAGVQRRRRIEARARSRGSRGVEDDRRDAELGERAHAGLGDAPARARCAGGRGSPARARSRGAAACVSCSSRSRLKWARRCMRARLAR